MTTAIITDELRYSDSFETPPMWCQSLFSFRVIYDFFQIDLIDSVFEGVDRLCISYFLRKAVPDRYDAIAEKVITIFVFAGQPIETLIVSTNTSGWSV